jgi:hypothetical protein
MKLVAHMGGGGGIAYKMVCVRPRGKGFMWRPRRTWESSIEMDLKEIIYVVVKWFKLS